MRAWVEYNVPVLALVNLTSGEVERVVQVDEETRPSGEVFQATEDGPDGAVSGPSATTATAIAENGEWPVWESGF